MQILYILIILLAANAFFSTKINTDNLLKKLALLFIIVGALVANYQFNRGFRIENPFLALGVTLHFTADYLTAHFRKKDQRATDEPKHETS